MTWTQNYDPLGSWPLSTALAALPVVALLGLLMTGKVNAWQSALAGLIVAFGIAVGPCGMPLGMASAAAGYGVIFALFRIVWLIVAAVFLYDIAVATGQFEVMKASIGRLSGDRRLQAILVAFSFGAFIEGSAGFGAPVAISAAFLVGLGFRPFQAAVLCLIANTAPVAWGAIGTPIKTLGIVTKLDTEALSACSGRILPPLSFIVPIWLVVAMVGWRSARQVWPAFLVVGGTFAAVQFLWSNYVGVDLVDIASAVASLVAGVALLLIWKPAIPWRFPEEQNAPSPMPSEPYHPLAARQVARAWMPFGLLSITVLIWGLVPVKAFMDRYTSISPGMPGLHMQVARGEQVLRPDTPPEKALEEAKLPIVPISSTGTAVFLAAVASGLLLGVSPVRLVLLFGRSVVRLIPAIATIFAMLALGFVTRYSGTDAILGIAFTKVGPDLFPIFGTLLGWLGVALTGSDTASNILFGNLQVVTATQLDLNPVPMASANTTGGVMGKMIDAQSIVVAAAATGEAGQEGKILRAVVLHSIALALLVGAIVWLYARVWPDLVPSL
ncbi:MAG: L-lactate permease [Isosphaeraceae bacterium]